MRWDRELDRVGRSVQPREDLVPRGLTTLRRALAGAILFAGSIAADPGLTLPRYSAEYHQKCALCHVNPSGGGMRSLYATQYLVPREMAWNALPDEILEKVDPRIGKNILVGVDMRLVQAHSDDPAQTTDFFQMQGDVYLAFELGPSATLYIDRGQSSTAEIYGLAYVLPIAGGYVKAGRFVPSFGWKLDDHTAYVRDELGFDPPSHSDVGVEFGASPGRWDVQAAVTNGNRGATLDTDARYALWLNGSYRFRVAALRAAAGVSAYREPKATETTRAGGFHAYAAWGPVTWIGETDWVRREPAGAAARTGLVASHEVSVRLRRGLDLLGSYDYLDPDVDASPGARRRWGAGFAVFWNSFVRFDAWYRRTTFDGGVALSGPDAYQTLVLAHLLY